MGVPTLSIIVPVYNAADCLHRCVDSILAQTFSDFEVILVDDGSTDGSALICDAYAAQNSRVRVIHQPNSGSSHTRKVGFLSAVGRYVGSVDSDDWIDPDFYARMLADTQDADAILCGFTSETPQGQIPEENVAADGFYSDEALAGLHKILLYSGTFSQAGVFHSLWSKVFRRELLCNVLKDVPTTIRMGDDAAVGIPAVLDAKTVIIRNDVKSYHYVRGTETLSTKFDPLYFDRIGDLYHWMKDSFTQRSSAVMLEQLPYYITFLLTVGAHQYMSVPGKPRAQKLKECIGLLSAPWILEMLARMDDSRVPRHIALLKKHLCAGNYLAIFTGYYLHGIARKLHL